MKKYNNLPLNAVKISDPTFAARLEKCISVTIPSALEKCDETGRLAAFTLTWKPGDEKMPHIFWDSDVAKVLEGVAYSLAISPNPELEKYYDELVDLIVSAQQPDGYLNTHFTVTEQDKRWSNLGVNHELYCAGHLMEAAVAAYELLGKRKFLDAMCRYADYIDSVFGDEKDGKRYGIPGHEEIELALVKLYRATGNRRYLNLAKYFIDARGQKPFFFRATIWDPEVQQNYKPVREQEDATGHAVRALYLYCGMADVAAETGDEALLNACKKIFDSIANKRMYITGGVGSSFSNEAFTVDYDLPNDSRSYAESCASIALVLFSWRMLQITGEGKYADVMERAMFNGSIAGISLSGDEFFYSNYLEMNDNYMAYNSGNRVRQKWFGCSCCPTSYCRYLTQLPQMLWSVNADHLRLNIPVQNTLSLPDKEIDVISNYPYDNKITVNIRKDGDFKLSLRIPGFAGKYAVSLNGETVETTAEAGFISFERSWKNGDSISLELDMPFEFASAHRKVTMNRGKVALTRGPLVYCCENTDQKTDVSSLLFDLNTKFTVKKIDGLNYGEAVEFDGFTEEIPGEELYSTRIPAISPCRITAIPYAIWQNRGETNMAVWFRYLSK